MKKHILIALMLSLSFSAQANNDGLCDKISTVKKNSLQALERYSFTQFGFDDAGVTTRDLAIIVHNVNLPAQIKRVTFGRGQAQLTCYFKPLAFTQGGEAEKFWGWHLLWAEPHILETGGLFYARMDGEAWVSSHPKSFTKLAPINPQFKLEKDTVTVTWQQVSNGVTVNMQAISSDEGRSWDIKPSE
jgi:hypothetical protein